MHLSYSKTAQLCFSSVSPRVGQVPVGVQGGDVSDTPLHLFDFRSLHPLRSEHGSTLQLESPIMALFKCFKGFFLVRNQNLSWVREKYPLQQEKLKYITDRVS